MKAKTYSETGVDIKKEETAVKSIVSVISATFKNRQGKAGEVKSGIGHFANFIEVSGNNIVMSTDGVGTKVLIAQLAEKFDTVGIDMVAMNVNDIICVGAEPIALVDYLAVEKIDNIMISEIAKGIRTGADQAGIAVIGGETASLRGVITGISGMGFDLAGTCIGIVGIGKTVLGDKIRPGDSIIGIASSGLHSNGFSLAREIILEKYKLTDRLPWGKTVSEELLAPTTIYVKPVLDMLSKHFDSVTGLCHITGGGLANLKRLNAGVGFALTDPLEPQPIFREIKKLGNVEESEMYRTFNMGMGFAVISRPDAAESIIRTLAGHGLKAKVVGRITKDAGTVELPAHSLKL